MMRSRSRRRRHRPVVNETQLCPPPDGTVPEKNRSPNCWPRPHRRARQAGGGLDGLLPSKPRGDAAIILEISHNIFCESVMNRLIVAIPYRMALGFWQHRLSFIPSKYMKNLDFLLMKLIRK
jgi:hypothetical protein